MLWNQTNNPIRTLFLFYTIFLLSGLSSFPLIDWDENIYGTVSKNMFLNGEFFRLTVNDQLYTEKPPYIFWITSLFYFCFGINEFATRLQAILSGLVCFISIYWFAKRHFSKQLATFWCLLYSSSLIPLVLSRTAYIDHWFNTFLFLSFCFLYEYYLKLKSGFKDRLPWIILSGIAIGFGVLTKGPLGLFFPVASFLFLLFIERKFRIFWLDVLLGFLVFLLVLSIYYVPNLLFYGTDTLKGFYAFQGMLLSKSLESHTGPWFYHFLVAFIGFFPWTALIFLGFRKQNLDLFFSKDSPMRAVSLFFSFWMLSLLVIFSIVQTKLPHYSSSLYLGLSFFGATLLNRWEQSPDIFNKRKLVGLTAFFGVLLGVLFFALPFLFQYLSTLPDFQKQYGSYPKDSIGLVETIPGVILFLGSLASLIWLNSQKIAPFVIHLWTTSQVFLVSLSLLLMPILLSLVQDKNLRLYDYAIALGGRVGFYKYLTFYPMFYRPESILIMGNYKFRDDSDYLTKEKFLELDKPLFLITTPNKLFELPFLYPDRKFELVTKDIDLILISVK